MRSDCCSTLLSLFIFVFPKKTIRMSKLCADAHYHRNYREPPTRETVALSLEENRIES
jgi:hypothetical protein